jgi:Disulphide bond corrector protein DsbC
MHLRLHAAIAIWDRCIRQPMIQRRRSSFRSCALTIVGLCSLAAAGSAQPPASVQWHASATHEANRQELLVRLGAEIPKGWHVYGITQVQGGPLPLVIRVEPGASYEILGKPQGTVPQKHHDASFDLDTEFYTDSLELKVLVRATKYEATPDVPLAVRFQMCSDTTCLPPKTVHLLAKSGS